MQKICGIDEAGRGCVAGDLCVGACVINSSILGLNDSKKLSSKKREILFDEITQKCEFLILTYSPLQIDEMGLSWCLKDALLKIKNHFLECEFIYDGNTSFGVSGIKTLIKADAQVPEVSAASILAKVTRDKNLAKLAPLYPQYDFNSNKGYCTKSHIEAIKKYGLCEVHRKSYKLKALEKSLFD